MLQALTSLNMEILTEYWGLCFVCLDIIIIRLETLSLVDHIVTCISNARKRLSKHIPAQANSLNNRMFVVSQRSCKRASFTTEDRVFHGVRA